MAPLALLAVWWVAHAADPTADISPPPPTPDGPASRERRGAPADLDIEGELMRQGLDPEQATQVSAVWTPPVAPPDPSVRAGRTDGWTFDRLEARIREVAFAARDVLTAQRTWSPNPRQPGCVPLEDPGTGDVTLLPLDPRMPTAPSLEEPHRVDVTFVTDGGERHAIVGLRAGESATVVEVERTDPKAPDSRRATTRRRLTVVRNGVRVDWRESAGGTALCVSPEPGTDPPDPRPPPRQPIGMTPVDGPPDW